MDTRVAAGMRLLAEHGLGHVSLQARGLEGEVAALAADPVALPRLRAVAAGLKALGFRYVALDLGCPDEGVKA